MIICSRRSAEDHHEGRDGRSTECRRPCHVSRVTWVTGRAVGFRDDLHGCLTAWSDELFDLTDAVLCADGPVRTLAGLSLAPEHRRGHGAVYDAVSQGRVEIARLRRTVARLPLPRSAGGRIVLAADVSPWLRPDAATSPDRLFCHVHSRGKGQPHDPGLASVVAGLGPSRTSWTAVLDAVRLGPEDEETAVTARQIRDVVTRLTEAEQWSHGDPGDPGRLRRRVRRDPAGLPAGRPFRSGWWLRSDRVLCVLAEMS